MAARFTSSAAGGVQRRAFYNQLVDESPLAGSGEPLELEEVELNHNVLAPPRDGERTVTADSDDVDDVIVPPEALGRNG